MKSPVGSRKTLLAVQLENGLTAYRCPDTGGHYIPAALYARWLGAQPARLPHLPPTGGHSSESVPDGKPYLCPETDTIMTRYKVGHDFRFTIDRSITGGVWLDAGEWEALRARSFHDEIHFVFTDPWQRNILRNEAAASARKRLEERVGAKLLGRVDALKDELAQSPHREELIAYLIRK